MTLELDRDISGLSLSWSTPKHSTDVPWCVGQHGMGCPPLHEPSPLKNLHERQGLLLLSWCQPEPASTEETCEGASSGSDIPRVWVCPDGFLSSAGQEGGAVPAGLAPNRQPGGGDSLCQEPPACPQQREGQSHRGEWGGDVHSHGLTLLEEPGSSWVPGALWRPLWSVTAGRAGTANLPSPS